MSASKHDHRQHNTRSPKYLPSGVAPGFTVTLWDAKELGRALAFGALALFLALLVTGATDEGGVAWSARAFRTLPLAPACAAAGTWLGQARGWARGEGRALAALGRSPLASSAAAVAGGAILAVAVAAAMAVSARVDVGGFYPTARAPDAYVSAGGGAFSDAAGGHRIEADGSIRTLRGDAVGPLAPPPSTPPGGRAAAALSTALAGLALPLLVARPTRGSAWVRVGAVGAMLFGATLCFHAAAAHRVAPIGAALPALVLLVFALARTRTRAFWRRPGS